MKRALCVASLAVIGVVAFSGCGSAASSRSADEAAIRKRLSNWPKAIAAGDVDEACDLFARDTVLIFPGQPNRGWRGECERLRDSMRGATQVRYDPPEIHEIIVDGDIAAVRLTWTAHIARGGGEDVEVERGLDVFERDDDGIWRIRISQAFPAED